MTTPRTDRPKGTGPFYLVALAGSLLSLDTAARYFSERMGIDGLEVNGFSVELAAVCGIGELTLVACGYAMRHNIRRDGKPGAARLVALVMCTAASFMAIALDGAIAGGLRAFFGPVLALIALHLALGIEGRVREGGSTGAWARVVAEMRERVMSRLGLGDDERKAAERSRDRARDRAARLATADSWTFRRLPRLAKAVRASGATLDGVQRDRLIEQVAVLRNLGDLITIQIASPWGAAADLRNPSTGGADTPAPTVSAPLSLTVSNPAVPVPAPPASTGTGTPVNGSGTPAAGVPPVGAGTFVTRFSTPLTEGPAPRANGTGSATSAPPVTSDGTPDSTPGDEVLLTVLRDPSRVPREGDGTVPIKRAMRVLGTGRDRAIRLLRTEGLLRVPDPDDGSGTPDGTPPAEGSGTGADDPERHPEPRINGTVPRALIGATS